MSENVNINDEYSDLSSDNESEDSIDSVDSEIETVIVKFSIPEQKKIAGIEHDVFTLILSNNKHVQTEFKYIQYFFETKFTNILTELANESGNESDDEDMAIEINIQSISEEMYMKYSAELYMLCI